MRVPLRKYNVWFLGLNFRTGPVAGPAGRSIKIDLYASISVSISNIYISYLFPISISNTDSPHRYLCIYIYLYRNSCFLGVGARRCYARGFQAMPMKT